MKQKNLALDKKKQTKSIYEKSPCILNLANQIKKQLIEAANRLLNCFEDLDKWPKLSVAISKKTWYTASVDDTTRDAIKHLGKLTGVIKNE